MNEVATELLKDVVDAFEQRDLERARVVWERDVELDALEDLVFRDLLTHMMEDPRTAKGSARIGYAVQRRILPARVRETKSRRGRPAGRRPQGAFPDREERLRRLNVRGPVSCCRQPSSRENLE